MTPFRLLEVDGWAERHALRRMQEICLPHDTPILPGVRYWWLVKAGGHPAAFASLTITSDGFGYLSRSGVLPEYRGKGLQAKLIRAREAKARSLGATWMESDTSDNPASGNSLIRCGYRLFTPPDPWGLSTSIYWRKKLA